MSRLATLARRTALPGRTVRLRLTALYGVLFLISGAVLLTITNLLFRAASRAPKPRVPGAALPPDPEPAQKMADAATQYANDLHQLLAGSAIALGIMAVVSILLGWFVAGRMLRPLREMTAAARRISETSLHERLAVSGPGDEIKDLGDTIDGLLVRLEGAFAAQRRFAADASHELRTPLATMRASLDVALAKPEPVPAQTVALAGRLRRELDQIDQLLESLLVLAGVQHGALPGRATLSLDDAVSAALAARAGAIAAMDLSVRRGGQPDVRVVGSQPLLHRLVDNVIDNAVHHNRRGGWIAVTTADGGVARLVVETGGEVLDQQQVERLTEPFRRLGTARTGSERGAGLGLSIVAAIAAAHGGTLELHARREGGLQVSVGLPLAPGTTGTGTPW